MLALPGGVDAVHAARDADVTLVTAALLPSAADVDDDKRLRTLRKDSKVSAVLHTRLPGAALGSRHRALRSRTCSSARRDPRDLTPDPGQALREADVDVSRTAASS